MMMVMLMVMVMMVVMVVMMMMVMVMMVTMHIQVVRLSASDFTVGYHWDPVRQVKRYWLCKLHWRATLRHLHMVLFVHLYNLWRSYFLCYDQT